LIDELESRLRNFVRKEVTDALTTSTKDILERAKRSEESGETLLSVVKWVSAGWLAIVTLMFGFLAFIGWREYGAVRIAKDESVKAKVDATSAAAEAVASADKVRSAEGEVGLATARIREIDKAIAQALADTSKHFRDLPEIERFGLVGEAPDLPSAEDMVRYEEADILIVIADKNNSIEKPRLVEPFVRLGTYWRLLENYPRSIARLQRAIEIDAQSIDAHRGLCAALYAAAGRDRVSAAEKHRVLERAQVACTKALELARGNPDATAGVLFDQGWIYDEQGRYELAIEAYRQAQQLDVRGERTNIGYNLACTYVKVGKYAEALAELRKVIDADDNLEDATADAELEPLRNHPEHRDAFRKMIEEATKRREATAPFSSSCLDPSFD